MVVDKGALVEYPPQIMKHTAHTAEHAENIERAKQTLHNLQNSPAPKEKKRHGVLTLNKHYVPIHIIEWGKAVSLMFQDHARALDMDYMVYKYEDWLAFSTLPETERAYQFVSSSRYKVAVPEIIVLTDYERLPTRDVKYSRQTVFQRDAWTCAYCGKVFDKKDLNIDHIVPRCKGGLTTWQNTITSCISCNSKKADKTLAEAGLKLLFQPKRPKWLSPLTRVASKEHPCKSWNHFLNRANVDMGD